MNLDKGKTEKNTSEALKKETKDLANNNISQHNGHLSFCHKQTQRHHAHKVKIICHGELRKVAIMDN